MIAYCHADSRLPFLWEDSSQPAARWHGTGEGPVQYFADTPAGAWAEFLRHEEITDEADLAGVSRSLWAVEIGDVTAATPALPHAVCRGGRDSYPACQGEAARLRAGGATAIATTSAALQDGAAAGWRVELGFREGPRADGGVLVLFGPRPDLVGRRAVEHGRPPLEVLRVVRQFSHSMS